MGRGRRRAKGASYRKFVVILLLIAGFTACATSPTGRRQLTLLPEDQLDAMGVQAFGQMKSSEPVEADSQTNDYVRCVAEAIIAELPPGTGYDWEVVVFKDDEPNAFALPGGKMGVHTGMLRVAENQDQLAAVLGHEVGHVLAHHANERASQQQLAAVGLSAAGASGAVDEQWLSVLGLGAQVGVILPYSRIHESEADIIGLDLMAKAGFDPRASIKLWQNMEKASSGAPPEFLSTHPASSTRIDNLVENLAPALRKYNQARSKGKTPRCK